MNVPNNENATSRATVIGAVQTPLGMLVLSALISEAILASTIFALPEAQRLIVVYLVAAMVLTFVFITVIIAWKKPDALYGRSSVNYKRFAEDAANQVFQSINPSLEDHTKTEVWDIFPGAIEVGRDSEPDEIIVLRKIISLEVRRQHQNTNGSSLASDTPAPLDD